MTIKISEDLLNLFDALLRAQLNTIRQLRKAAGMEEKPPKVKSMSHMDIVYDILTVAQRPMHVDDIIAQAKQKFDIELDKESVVSALIKRVKRQDRFMKVGPNTFTLISQEMKGDRP